MMAALVGGFDAKNLTIDLECTLPAYLPFGFGTPPGHHRGVVPSSTGRLVSAKASSIVLTHC